MKKRILSILLTLCMMLCLTPISVFAEEVGAGGSAAIQLGADAISVLSKNVNTATAPTVYFGQNHDNNPAAWRVIGYDGSGVASSHGDITMLAANNMGLSKFGASNAYADSALKEAIDALADKLTAKETDAVEKRTLASGNYDGENTDGVAGPAVSNAVFWPLSSKEANAVNNDLRVVDPEHPGWASSYWWLRSPDEDDSTAYVAGRGEVRYYGGYSTSKEFGVRPAFDLNLDSVLFASAAVGGKPDGGLQPVSPNYTGNEWKLTLYDSKRNNFSRTTWEVSASTKGGTVEISYTDAKTGANEYISALIFDDVGNVIYYGRSNASLTEKDGTAQLTIPAGFAEGTYTLEVFNEQYNGDRKTDLASGFADVTLTVEKRVDEQFTLTPGGRYYFDLSAMDIPGTVNSNLPDSTLHYVPFTYAGTVDAYVLKPASNHVEDSSEQASVTKDKNAQYGYAYEHSLFIADYRVTTNISWIDLNNAGFIFGKTNTAGGINYTLRAPTMGSIYKSPMRGAPANNEWDQILAKNSDFIKELDINRNISLFWGQDTSRSYDFNIRKTTRNSVNNFMGTTESSSYGICFRPVLEVMNPDTLGSDGLKAVTLDLGGGTLGNSSDAIQIIVKNGSTFTAPASDGLTRPDGDTDNYFMWLDGNGNSYEPGASVPADVTELTVQWTAPTYTVTLHTNGGTINNGNVAGYTYGVGATLPAADDMTYTGHTFKGWYDNENLTGSPVTAIGSTETGNKEYWAKWEANTYPVTFYPTGGSSSSEDRDDPSGNAFITDRPNKDNPTTPTTAKSNSVKVDSKGNAVITRSIVADVISVAQSESIKHGNTKNGIAVVVPVEISKALAGVQITLKADALDKLVSSGVKRFTIDTDSMADFGFMLDTLKELNRQTTGDLILKMKKTAVTSQEVETAIGNRPVYDITLWEVKNGKETAVNLSGKTVSIAIPYTPAKNEKPGNLYAVYVDENGNVQWISKSSYNMDQKAVIFVAEHFSIYGIGYKNQIPAFTDVNNHWAKDNMLFVVSRGLLSGTSATTFSPNTGMTRGMFVTALGRLAGVDPTDYQASMFTDVKEDAYYAPYVNWAAKTGVVSGTTDTTFAPDTNINREQMAVIMKNYATKLGYTIPKTLEVVNFADSAGISSWAKEAVKSMQQAGILAGKTNNCFDPAGTATRAEVATVLRRFVEIVIDPQTANGWVQNDSGEWSYYKNGDLVKGWLSNDQKWYWLDKNTGKMFSGGWKQIDGKQYYFYADGSMAVNTTVDGKTIGADGARK